ncbi:CvpA family protein [Alteribacillus sp. JSM 102045]|uniref:CvpA family protein n=1 Tax=Alteribacillus sp. JSM 102045 TaxID=1562101 RepID=UPI0035C1AD40
MLVNIIIILLLIGSFFIGLRQGFVSKFVRLSSFLLALAAGFFFYNSIASWLRTWVPYPEFLGVGYEGIFYTVLGFFSAFIITNLMVLWLGKILQVFASLPILRTINKGLGGVFGVVKTYVVILILLIGVSFFPIESVQAAIDQSSVATIMMEKTPFISDFY